MGVRSTTPLVAFTVPSYPPDFLGVFYIQHSPSVRLLTRSWATLHRDLFAPNANKVTLLRQESDVGPVFATVVMPRPTAAWQ